MSMPFSDNKQRLAFTLLELMITTAIVGILSAMMFTNFSKEKKRNALKSSIHQMQTDLKTMQTNAQGGVQTGGTVPRGYGIKFVRNTNSYLLYADNATVGAQFYDAGNDTFSTRSMGLNVTMVSPTDLDVEFTSPNGKAVFQDGATTDTIILKQSDLGICYSVSVVANVGTVSVRQLSVACP